MPGKKLKPTPAHLEAGIDYPVAKDLNAAIEVLQEVSKDLKQAFDGALGEMRTNFLNFLKTTIVHYETIRGSHIRAYMKIISDAQKDDKELLESMDDLYGELKERCAKEHTDAAQPLANITESYSVHIKDLQSQPAEDEALLERLKSTRDAASSLHTEMEREYKKLLDEIERNFQSVRKLLILPEIKLPHYIPDLDVNPDLRIMEDVEVPPLFPVDNSGQPVLEYRKRKGTMRKSIAKSLRVSISQVNKGSGKCWASKLCKKLKSLC